MLHGILRFDRHPSMMMGFLRNTKGIRLHMRYLWYASSLLVGNMSKYSAPTPSVVVLPSSSGYPSLESSFFLINSINKASPSSPFVQTTSVSDDSGTNPSDSKNELNLRTFSVMNATDRSGGVEGLTWIFSGLSYSTSSFTFAFLS
ncbi:hypothetical protein Tco_0559741 [Tanacetum coccineum]